MSRAPIALFVYNRLRHLQQVISNLKLNKECPETDIIIFSDNCKPSENDSKVAEVRSFISEIKGFKSLKIVERTENFGLSKSIISGVNEILEDYNSVIVLEDDIVPTPFFLQYINQALERYEEIEKVGSIHAYSYPTNEVLPETFLLRGADCWGWATWSSSWALFEERGDLLLEKIHDKNLVHSFDLDGCASFSRMLKDQVEGKIDSWAIRWHASMYLNKKLCLHPGRSLVKNIGLDSSGTHCPKTNSFDTKLSRLPVSVGIPKLEESNFAREAIKKFFVKNDLLAKK